MRKIVKLAPQAVERRITQAGGRPTDARKRVLGILLAADHALSHAEIEAAAQTQGTSLDRVTLYRVLDWLVSKGLAHKVPGNDQSWRFNAVSDETHGHAHFHCTHCGQVFCLEGLAPNFAVSLPRGFQFDRAELTVAGTCPRCADR